MSDTGPTSTVKSAMRTLDILELLVAQGRPLAAHEIATALVIPVSSLSYLLTTLADRGYIERLGRKYGPGQGLARLQPGRVADSLIQRAVPVVRSLRVRLNETAGFFVPRGHEVEAAVSEIGTHALRYTLDVGQRAPMHAFAAGKAILATYDEAGLAEYFAGSERQAFTAQTLTEEADLRVELDSVRRSGVARTREEHTPGIQGMARVVMADGRAAGAISIAIPLPRVTPELEAETIDLLKRSVDLLEHPEQAQAEREPAA
ncbi:IclR family transcriptional regulator [Brevundimonas aurifodinae]|uniref:IclR family transcriptional regulator n=2 Tax=Brevundimonas TaxID=41275 RepID=A0ABV1NLP1_9CAUL|nr:MAG: IclR family transcriptional regulator [Brevundimonas sp. 12-68-7]OYX30273.1 MAG: IclR family transcriptional regulator [Brevundimonas subvibrioides]